jgi:hypothetical protein
MDRFVVNLLLHYHFSSIFQFKIFFIMHVSMHLICFNVDLTSEPASSLDNVFGTQQPPYPRNLTFGVPCIIISNVTCRIRNRIPEYNILSEEWRSLRQYRQCLVLSTAGVNVPHGTTRRRRVRSGSIYLSGNYLWQE